MTLETEISKLVKQTTELLAAYTQQTGTISTLQSDVTKALGRVTRLEKILASGNLYTEMAFPQNLSQIAGAQKSEPDALAFAFTKQTDYDLPNVVVLDPEEEVKILHDISIPTGTRADLHVLCTVGDAPAEKRVGFISILRKNRTSPSGQDYYSGSPDKPNIISGSDGKTVFRIEAYGESGASRGVTRVVIPLASALMGPNYGSFRIYNLGTNKLHVYGIGIVIKAQE